MAIKIKVRDWNAKPWAGRSVLPQGALRAGTLTGYVADGEYASHVRVAFSPDESAEYPVEDVELG